MRFLNLLKHMFFRNPRALELDPEVKEYIDEAVSEAMGAAETTVAEQDIGELIHVTTENLPGTLKHMGLGMLSIFLVIGVIVLLIFILNKIMNRSPKKKEQ